MQMDTPNFLIAASAMQAVVLSLFLLLPPNIEKTSNKLLIVILISFSAEYVEFLLSGIGLTTKYPNFAYVGTLIAILQPPAIYLYTKSLMYRGFEVKPHHSVHLLPFALTSVMFIFEYYIQPDIIKEQIIQQQDLPGIPSSIWLALAVHGVFLFYLFCAIKMLHNFSIGIKGIFSDVDSKQISWLKILLLGYAIVWAVSLAYCLSFYIFKRPAGTEYVRLFGGVAGFAFINILVFYALKQSVLFSGLTKEEGELLTDEPFEDKITHATAEQKKRIAQFMELKQPFLNSNLSINQLAKQIGIPPRELSFVINKGFKTNFFDFIGGYRIQHAKHLLVHQDSGKTILDVMYESGFNSKSVFNTAFKQETGMTPSQYKKKHTIPL